LFPDTSATRNHGLDDDKLFLMVDPETAAQDEFPLSLFDKYMPLAQRAADFLTDDDPPKGWGKSRCHTQTPAICRRALHKRLPQSPCVDVKWHTENTGGCASRNAERNDRRVVRQSCEKG